jgi:hypothetical protein
MNGLDDTAWEADISSPPSIIVVTNLTPEFFWESPEDPVTICLAKFIYFIKT